MACNQSQLCWTSFRLEQVRCAVLELARNRTIERNFSCPPWYVGHTFPACVFIGPLPLHYPLPQWPLPPLPCLQVAPVAPPSIHCPAPVAPPSIALPSGGAPPHYPRLPCLLQVELGPPRTLECPIISLATKDRCILSLWNLQASTSHTPTQ